MHVLYAHAPCLRCMQSKSEKLPHTKSYGSSTHALSVAQCVAMSLANHNVPRQN
jgi:hypothetical protein